MFICPDGYLKNSGFNDPSEILIAVSTTLGSSLCAGIAWPGFLRIDKIMKTVQKIKTPLKVLFLLKYLIF
jgi:hypothetical protein|tara:strand:- start:28 stop:237 length:210 start_codon:yes stop_codon:yes gene_type:complete